ncbi:MAG: polyhydroxyalkanoic acid synthase [Gammaproteobacteria bacterium]|nr:polyhydroxyalkanoic acid synthase [Gammaproteobacteria bacterium]MCW5582848.1 polyhydroxyalkanoic acid synthase [Gammaproteobacteria bacterium]
MIDTHWSGKKEQAEAIDRSLQVAISKLTGGISPASLLLAFFDWYFHLLLHPDKQMELTELYQENMLHLAKQYLGHLSGDPSGEYCVITSPQDKRFIDKNWQQFPYTFYYESFLLIQNWWHTAATSVRGVSQHHQDVVDFTLRQIIDMLSPSNSVFSNPEIQQAAIEQKGENFVRGLENFLDDTRRHLMNEPPAGAENFVIGENIAASPGKVIYRNHLIELIQYAPLTEKVYAEPVLITPAWIMKYYILDLTPKHSLVKYLVEKGHTVFMISWKNPKRKDRDLGMDDYLNLGIMSAVNTISKVIPEKKIHLIGYCLGGTLTAIATATMARDNDHRLGSMTLFAAQTDFNDPGELGLFIDESQITFLESIMQERGYLDTHQMAGAFQLLRSNDLIWSRLIHDYLLGVRKPLTDLMAWNADATRMPYKMHSEYLRRLFLHNELAEGKFSTNGKPIALTDISIPIFVVATERDHVSPWHSVFKINLLTTSDVTFALTSGGHNVGIVSMPSKTTKRYYRISTLKEGKRFIDADNWYLSTKPIEGSWWLPFEKWLAKRSGKKVNVPEMGCKKENILPLEDAPGSYVRQK